MRQGVQRLMIVAAAAALASGAAAQAPAAQVQSAQAFPTALVDNPCPPALAAPAQGAAQPVLDAYRAAQAERASKDWPNLCRYKAANAGLSGRPRVVFIGDSITQGWVRDTALFGDGVVGRGISSQTTPQMLVRFYPDVVALRPAVVHIMAGTNDAAGNSGPTTLQDFKNNIMAMVDLARANNIKVVLGSIPPAAAFRWSPTHRPAQTIVEMNRWLRAYAAEKGLVYADYHGALADPSGAFRSDLADDGVHPTAAGYAVMRPIALQAIAAAER